MLESNGFQLKRTNGGDGRILHDKFAVFDRRLVLTGSFNWSTSAEENNDENFIAAGSCLRDWKAGNTPGNLVIVRRSIVSPHF